MYLVCAANEIEVVLVEKLVEDVWTKDKGHAAIVLTPPLCVLVGVSPQQIAQHACVCVQV